MEILEHIKSYLKDSTSNLLNSEVSHIDIHFFHHKS